MKNHFLRNAFNTSVAGLAALPLAAVSGLLANVLWKDSEAKYPTASQEPLTEGENAIVKSIFGSKVRTSKITKHFPSVSRERPIAQTLGKNKIKFFDLQYKSADYSQTGNLMAYRAFIHEMTHVWQNQHTISNFYRGIKEGLSHHDMNEYDYELTPQSRFKDFGKEQQGAIIDNYACQFLFTGTVKAGEIRARNLVDADAEKLELLKKVVEDQFPEARTTRLAAEAQKKPAAKKPKLG